MALRRFFRSPAASLDRRFSVSNRVETGFPRTSMEIVGTRSAVDTAMLSLHPNSTQSAEPCDAIRRYQWSKKLDRNASPLYFQLNVHLLLGRFAFFQAITLQYHGEAVWTAFLAAQAGLSPACRLVGGTERPLIQRNNPLLASPSLLLLSLSREPRVERPMAAHSAYRLPDANHGISEWRHCRSTGSSI